MSVLQVDREYEVPRIRDVGVNLLVKIARSEKEMWDEQVYIAILEMMEMLSSPHDQLLVRLEFASSGILYHPRLPLAIVMVMSFSNIMTGMAMSHNNFRWC